MLDESIKHLLDNSVTHTTSPQVGDMALSVRGVSKTFAGLKAVDDVSFDLRAGSLLGIIGPNGAGKSTLINVVTGLYTPDGGTVHFEGREVTRSSLSKRARLGLLRSFQHARSFDSLTVTDALLLGTAAPRPRSLGVGRNEALQTLEEFGLAPFRAQQAEALPYGAKKVLNLALASLARPRVLFLDEPFAGVGPDDVERLAVIVEKFKADGVAVAAVEHNIEALLRLADRVTVLDSGRLIFSGTPAETRTSEVVAVAYLGQGAAAEGTRQ
jgi:branched-chain amino acid transport system ATP-binding protein